MNKATRKAAFRPFNKEDRAFDNVVGMLRKKHGESGVLTKDSPKPKATSQPKRKPEKDTRSSDQKMRDAVYGVSAANPKGFPLRT